MQDGTQHGRRPLNQCAVCEQDFGSLRLFDVHHVGPHDGDRRCLTVAEMTGRGWRLDRSGRWRNGRGWHGDGPGSCTVSASEALRVSGRASDLAWGRRAA